MYPSRSKTDPIEPSSFYTSSHPPPHPSSFTSPNILPHASPFIPPVNKISDAFSSPFSTLHDGPLANSKSWRRFNTPLVEHSDTYALKPTSPYPDYMPPDYHRRVQQGVRTKLSEHPHAAPTERLPSIASCLSELTPPPISASSSINSSSDSTHSASHSSSWPTASVPATRSQLPITSSYTSTSMSISSLIENQSPRLSQLPPPNRSPSVPRAFSSLNTTAASPVAPAIKVEPIPPIPPLVANSWHISAQRVEEQRRSTIRDSGGGGNVIQRYPAARGAYVSPPAFSSPHKQEPQPVRNIRKRMRTHSAEMELVMIKDRNAKIREYILQNFTYTHPQLPPPGLSFTPRQFGNNRTAVVMTCLHCSVAQKSYGSEKRFLCPPPVVSISGLPKPNPTGAIDLNSRYTRTLAPEVSLAVICEDSVQEQTEHLEDASTIFKYLHVTSTAKAKQFHLRLRLHTQYLPTLPVLNTEFVSEPIAIISKPSKKTTKSKNISSCILRGTRVALFNRINSQTVRTKYVGVDRGRLCAKSVGWSAFNVRVLSVPQLMPRPSRRGCRVAPIAPEAGAPSLLVNNNTTCVDEDEESPIFYGSEIVLTDVATGISSEPLIVRKVEKGRVSVTNSGPVSQMQKIALQRPGENAYLCAAMGEVSEGLLTFQRARQPRENGEVPSGYGNEGGDGMGDDVEDSVCWTIVGVSEFKRVFGVVEPAAVRSVVRAPPHLVNKPIYKPGTHTLELAFAGDVDVFYSKTKGGEDEPMMSEDKEERGMEVWLGPHGPLPTKILDIRPGGRQKRRMVEQEGKATNKAQLESERESGEEEKGGEASGSCRLLVELPMASEFSASVTVVAYPVILVRRDGVVYPMSWGMECLFGGEHRLARWSVKEMK
ncbi:uncharacterized protein VTP21DRAFT_224 [Calcarisporiella thermophila]|uniref:uncharacterized protein n=1 Tax=Calcarisporiella thermophila TaxID=911321 RepID=UPI003743540D